MMSGDEEKEDDDDGDDDGEMDDGRLIARTPSRRCEAPSMVVQYDHGPRIGPKTASKENA